MSTTTPARAPHKITKITLADNTLGDAYSGASLSTTALGLRYVQCCGGHHVGGNPLISTDPKFKYLACSLTGDNASYAQGRWYLLAEVDKCDACDHVFCMNLDPELSCRYSAGQPREWEHYDRPRTPPKGEGEGEVEGGVPLTRANLEARQRVRYEKKESKYTDSASRYAKRQNPE